MISTLNVCTKSAYMIAIKGKIRVSDLGKVLAWPDLEIAAVGECLYRTLARAKSLVRASLVQSSVDSRWYN